MARGTIENSKFPFSQGPHPDRCDPGGDLTVEEIIDRQAIGTGQIQEPGTRIHQDGPLADHD